MVSNRKSDINLVIDTDIFSYVFKKTEEEHKFTPLKYGVNTCISFVTVGEAYFGARKAKWGTRMVNELKTELARYIVLFPDYEICLLCGDLKAACVSKGCPMGDPDYWIAACALYYNSPSLNQQLEAFQEFRGSQSDKPRAYQLEILRRDLNKQFSI